MQILGADGPGGEEEQPCAERHEMEDADHLVDGRVVDALLVTLVEPVHLGPDDPRRDRQDKHRDLHQRIRGARAGDDQLREEVREQQARNVCREECALDEPAATPANGRHIDPRPLVVRERGRALAQRRIEIECRHRPRPDHAYA